MLKRIITCSLLAISVIKPNPTPNSWESIFQREAIIEKCLQKLGKKIDKKTNAELSIMEFENHYHLSKLKSNIESKDDSGYQETKITLKKHQNKYVEYLRKKIEKIKK